MINSSKISVTYRHEIVGQKIEFLTIKNLLILNVHKMCIASVIIYFPKLIEKTCL